MSSTPLQSASAVGDSTGYERIHPALLSSVYHQTTAALGFQVAHHRQEFVLLAPVDLIDSHVP